MPISNTLKSPFSITSSGKPKNSSGLLSTPTVKNTSIGANVRLGPTGAVIPVANQYAGAIMTPKPGQPAPAGPAPTTPAPAPTAPIGASPSVQIASSQPITAPTPPKSSSGLFPDVVSSLAKRGNSPSTSVEKGQSIYDERVQDLADFRMTAADLIAGQSGRGVPLQVVTGRQAALREAALAKEQILTDAISQAQTAIGLGQTQQGLEQSALTSAAGLVQPQVTGFGQAVFNPATGQFDGGGAGNSALNPLNNIESIAQQVASGQLSPSQAEAMGGSVQNFAGALNQAILAKNPSYNRAAAQAAFDANQSNLQTAGTAQTDIARAGLQEATQNYVQANTAFDQAKNQGANLQNAMNNVNVINSRYANVAVNNLRNQFGDAKFSAFITALAEARQAYTSLLASVGAATPTVNGVQADMILDSSATPAQINAAIAELDKAAYAKLLPLYQQMSTYGQNLGGGGTFNSPSASTGGGIFSW